MKISATIKDNKPQPVNYNISFPNKVYNIMITDAAETNNNLTNISCFTVEISTLTNTSFSPFSIDPLNNFKPLSGNLAFAIAAGN